MMSPTPNQVPTTLFTGFLGSGKTTIISHLIDELQSRGEQVVFIKNEIGEENIDGQILQGKHIKTRELLNGCICCTLVGPFISAIDEMISTLQPDRIIIEASGAADPAAIALMIGTHPGLYRDGVISVIDVVNFEGYKDISFTAQQQAKFTDLIVFNKIELANDDRKRAVVGYVRELNSFAPIIEAPKGKLSVNLVFGLSTVELAQLLETTKVSEDEHTHQPHLDHDHSHHLEIDHIDSFKLELPGILNEDKVRTFLTQLPKTVFRVKGFIRSEASTAKVVNKVGQRIEFNAVPTGFQPSQNTLIFIGFEIKNLEENLKTLLTSS